MKTYRGVEVQLHPWSLYLSGKEPPELTGQEAGWAPVQM